MGDLSGRSREAARRLLHQTAKRRVGSGRFIRQQNRLTKVFRDTANTRQTEWKDRNTAAIVRLSDQTMRKASKSRRTPKRHSSVVCNPRPGGPPHV
jgi:hypothetical protein